MSIVSIIALFFALIIWVIVHIQAERHARDAGEPLRTRKQLRYMRRKARQTGTTMETVAYKPRPGNRAYPIFHEDWIGPDGKPLPPDRVPPDRAPASTTLARVNAWCWFAVACIVAAVWYVVAGPQRPTPAPVAASAPAATDAAAPQVAAPSARPIGSRDGRTKQGSNVRAGPSGTAPVLRTVADNTTVRIVEVSGGWMRVSVGDAPPIGWIHGSLIE